MPRTVTAAERKIAYGVSLTKKQRATFKAIGGSRWLQAHLDKLAERTEATKRRAA